MIITMVIIIIILLLIFLQKDSQVNWRTQSSLTCRTFGSPVHLLFTSPTPTPLSSMSSPSSSSSQRNAKANVPCHQRHHQRQHHLLNILMLFCIIAITVTIELVSSIFNLFISFSIIFDIFRWVASRPGRIWIVTMLTTSSANTSGGFQELSKGGLRLDLFLPLVGSKDFLKKV